MNTASYYAFSLPDSLLDTLIPRNVSALDKAEDLSSKAESHLPTTSGWSRKCNICPDAVFSGAEEQRSHFRSDWHRYNTKTRLNGGHPVTEAAFVSLVDGE
jgi:hypothetical protein